MSGEKNDLLFGPDPAITPEQEIEARERVATAQRDANGRFIKGVSGNSSGRPKELAEVKALAASFTADAIATLAKIMLDPRAQDRDRRGAADSILDRAWGKPAQAVEVTGRDGGPLEHADKTPVLTSEQRGRKLIEMLNQVVALAGKADGDTESTDPKTETTERERP